MTNNQVRERRAFLTGVERATEESAFSWERAPW